jgi:hypothetical protein
MGLAMCDKIRESIWKAFGDGCRLVAELDDKEAQ